MLFCYGDTIYNPSGVYIPQQLVAHETVHSMRQMNGGLFEAPDQWWDKYLTDPEWRLSEELLAHRVEFQTFSKLGYSRTERRVYLKVIAERLSGPLYNRMVSFERAKKLIKGK